MTEASSRVRLELESRAENVALIRSALSALADVTQLGQALLTDLKTALSEACNNVVVHAYGPRSGPMIVTIEVTHGTVKATVRDHGSGITHIGGNEDHLGLGFGVMSALADRFEVITPRQGTEVRMCFNRIGHALVAEPQEPDGGLGRAPLALTGDAVVWVEPVALLAPVFGRVLRAYAAASWFTADRVDELPAVAAALSDFAARAGDGSPVAVAMAASRRRLGLISGPFPNAGPSEVGMLEHLRQRALVEELDLSVLDGQTMLRLTVHDTAERPDGGRPGP